MKYLNNSYAVKTFYGVTFNPGEVHSVPGVIRDPKFFRMDDSVPETGSAKPEQSDKPKLMTKKVKPAEPGDEPQVIENKLPIKEETK